jgi:multimeric flavodoxin WrbA
MQEIYDYIQECDNVIIASPIFFTELSGSLLALSSRLQTYFCARFMRKEIPVPKSKRGGILLVEGGTDSLDKALDTARVLLETMNAKDIGPAVCSLNTDHKKLEANPLAMEDIKTLAAFFNH